MGYKWWTKEEDAQLIELYKNNSTSDCANKMGKSFGAVKSRARALRLFKTPEAIKELAKRRNSGQFTKKRLPHNTVLDGCISLRQDKNNHYYYHIRLSLSAWKMLHVYMYELAHGAIPKGYIVVFKDQNTLNCTIENLELITREENMKRNTIHRYPEEIKTTIKMLSTLKKKIRQHEKQD